VTHTTLLWIHNAKVSRNWLCQCERRIASRHFIWSRRREWSLNDLHNNLDGRNSSNIPVKFLQIENVADYFTLKQLFLNLQQGFKTFYNRICTCLISHKRTDPSLQAVATHRRDRCWWGSSCLAASGTESGWKVAEIDWQLFDCEWWRSEIAQPHRKLNNLFWCLPTFQDLEKMRQQ